VNLCETFHVNNVNLCETSGLVSKQIVSKQIVSVIVSKQIVSVVIYHRLLSQSWKQKSFTKYERETTSFIKSMEAQIAY
jgi:hypothetical protein